MIKKKVYTELNFRANANFHKNVGFFSKTIKTQKLPILMSSKLIFMVIYIHFTLDSVPQHSLNAFYQKMLRIYFVKQRLMRILMYFPELTELAQN